MRLFTAIELSEPYKKEIEGIQEELRVQGVRGSFSSVDNLHLTLCFLGETKRVLDAGEVIHSLLLPKARITIEGYGAFAGGRGHLTIQKDPGLMELQELVRKAYLEHGFSLEDRPYYPHITLGRRMEIPEGVDPMVICRNFQGISMEVTGISLMESILGETPIYRRRLFVPVAE